MEISTQKMSYTFPIPEWMAKELEESKAKSGGCDAVAAECLCRFKAGHKGKVHRCNCGGAWTGTEPDIKAIRFPGGLSAGQAFARVLGL
jgi:hypothetical protein